MPPAKAKPKLRLPKPKMELQWARPVGGWEQEEDATGSEGGVKKEEEEEDIEVFVRKLGMKLVRTGPGTAMGHLTQAKGSVGCETRGTSKAGGRGKEDAPTLEEVHYARRKQEEMLQEAKEKAARTNATEAKFRAEVRVEELRPKLKVNPYLKRIEEEDTLVKRFGDLTRNRGKKQGSIGTLEQRSEEEAFQRKSEEKRNKKRGREQKKQEKAQRKCEEKEKKEADQEKKAEARARSSGTDQKLKEADQVKKTVSAYKKFWPDMPKEEEKKAEAKKITPPWRKQNEKESEEKKPEPKKNTCPWRKRPLEES